MCKLCQYNGPLVFTPTCSYFYVTFKNASFKALNKEWVFRKLMYIATCQRPERSIGKPISKAWNCRKKCLNSREYSLKIIEQREKIRKQEDNYWKIYLSDCSYEDKFPST